MSRQEEEVKESALEFLQEYIETKDERFLAELSKVLHRTDEGDFQTIVDTHGQSPWHFFTPSFA